MQRKGFGRLAQGVSAVAVAVATAAAMSSATAYAADNNVFAQGRDVGNGLCEFDVAISPPAGMVARADEQCRLLAVPAPAGAAANLTVGAAAMPKAPASGASPSPAGGGIDGVNLGDLRLLGSDDTKAANADAYQGWARYKFWNESNQLMYHDEIAFTWGVSPNSGIVGLTVQQAFCATGAVTFPHRPGIETCGWQPGVVSADTFSFRSYGTYNDAVLLLPFDRRKLESGFTFYRDGNWTRNCGAGAGSLPIGWYTTGCDVGVQKVAR